MCLTGLQDVPVFHYKTKEVLVGQNASLPCLIKNVTYNIVIVSTEWTKKDPKRTKLALFTPGHDYVYFVPNVTLKTIYNGNDRLIGTHVELLNVDKRDAGTYICYMATYPSGSFKRETELKVKGMHYSPYHVHIYLDRSLLKVHTG
uniref:Ig-like domain-containing protein n=1 Tax=Neogobius melanostomus TaxID=47308 RepID=A0A8C6SSF4_9GOBI